MREKEKRNKERGGLREGKEDGNREERKGKERRKTNWFM